MEPIQAKEKNVLLKKTVVVCLILLLAVIAWFVVNKMSPHDKYKGQLAGLVGDMSDTSFVVYNPKDNTMKELAKLENISSDNYAVVNSTGTYIAYTKWNQAGTKRTLTIKALNSFFGNSEKEYFTEMPNQQEIKYLSWFPDGKRLLYLKNDVSSDFAKQEINVLDTETGKTTTIAQGGIWDGRNWVVTSDKKDGMWEYYMSQKELDGLIKKYGGRTIPIEKASRKMWVEFSFPTISSDGEKIAYSATLFRNAAAEGDRLWMASGIWVAGVNGKASELVYASQDESSIGRVAWEEDRKNLIFLRYAGINGENGKIASLDLTDKSTKIIVPVTKDHFTNLEPIPLENGGVSFISVPKNGTKKDAKQLILNTKTGEILEQTIKHNGEKQLLWRFTKIN
ncbi:hypothetical protein C2W64_00936 [Brevibacillus laterosporus]|nr:hypothetical protein [Brevibacillus laterosporus]RAP27437.1 hypothetical protein C2W64_00936 [Brevibacillus laterosporus]